MKSVVEVAKTAFLCAVCYGLGFVVVQVTWPTLSGLSVVASMPSWLPATIASGTAALLLFVITHMERGQLDPMGYNFLMLYGIVCLGFGLSTLHPSQYNCGTAAMEMAFVFMCAWKAYTKYKGEKSA
jgi:hypothetical protein